MRLVVVLTLFAAVWATGCVAGAGGPPEAGSASGDVRPSATAALTTSPDPSATAVAQEPYSESAFWDRFGGTEQQGASASLKDLIGASDLVIVGTVQGVAEGRQIPVPETGETQYMANLTVTIDDVISGKPVDSKVVKVETLLSFSPPGSILDAMVASAPKGRQVLLILQNRTADVLRLGLPKDHPLAANDTYFLASGIESYVLNVEGKAGISSAADTDWLRNLGAKPFGEVVKLVRDSAVTSG